MTSNDYSKQELKEKIVICSKILFEKDSFLLKNGLHKRSTVHKFAEYLQILFSNWNVDFEYDKDIDEDGIDSKREPGIRSASHKTDRVVPDIIIHKRGTHENLLVIEIKKVEDNEIPDIKKLIEFTSPSGNHKYKLGLFIEFHSIEEPTERWFENGNEISL
jgi:hypothetical protein